MCSIQIMVFHRWKHLLHRLRPYSCVAKWWRIIETPRFGVASVSVFRLKKTLRHSDVGPLGKLLHSVLCQPRVGGDWSWPWNIVLNNYLLFLSAFSKLRKATTSPCLSVRKEQLGSHWTDFHEIWYLSIFSKICRENSSLIKVWQE